MISYIEGEITVKEPTHINIEANGLGYEVKISLSTYQVIKDLSRYKIHTHLHVKEDAHTLYGFYNVAEKRLFLDLISISGVGPGTGLVILSSMPPEDLKRAIINGQTATIQSIKGIGAKTAQRIILELRDKFSKESLGTASTNISGISYNTASREALSALVTLGINKAAAEKSINSITRKHGEEISVEEIIKLALKTS